MKFVLIMIAMTLAAAGAQAQDLRHDGLRAQGPGAQVVAEKELQFPRDHAAHPDYGIEWWYLTARLKDSAGRLWALQWTLFRRALGPEQVADGSRTNQVWMAHAAIITPDGNYHEQRFARGGIGRAGVNRVAEDGYFNAWMDDWDWRSRDAALFPARLKFSVGEREVILLLESDGGPDADGTGGYGRESERAQAGYFYSQPRIRVRGFVDKGAHKTYLKGQGWLDRRWSSQVPARDPRARDWLSLHLDGGHRLMIYRSRHEDGEHRVSGSWIDPRGETQLLGRHAVNLSATRRAEARAGSRQARELPLEWQLELIEQQRSWRIRPLYDRQRMAANFPYWDGVVLVEDEQGVPAGVGFMGLTGSQ